MKKNERKRRTHTCLKFDGILKTVFGRPDKASVTFEAATATKGMEGYFDSGRGIKKAVNSICVPLWIAARTRIIRNSNVELKKNASLIAASLDVIGKTRCHIKKKTRTATYLQTKLKLCRPVFFFYFSTLKGYQSRRGITL